jgi:hypothetical protein
MSESAAAPSVAEAGRLPVGVWVLALLFVVLHLLPQPGYEFHRDELLYLAMGDHLDLFRMQFPPMIAMLAEAARALPLELLHAIRLLSALAGASLTILAALACRELGGGRRAQLFSAVAVFFAPIFLRAGTLFQPVVFEQVWWTLAVLGLAKRLRTGDRRWWLLVGAALGLGALTKFSVAFLGLGLLAATLLSPLRHDLRTRWPWFGAALAALLSVPALAGQVVNDWPFLTQAAALQAGQLDRVSRMEFFTGQSLNLGPGAPLWLLGLLALLLSRHLRSFRPLGILAATIFLTFLVVGGKPYYFGPVLPMLIAAASAWASTALARPVPAWAFGGGLALFGLGGLTLLPIGVPLLPPAPMAQYAEAVGITRATTTNYGTVLPLPQDYADMTGWKELVDSVASVYRALPDAERASTAIFGINYGRTGALAVYGPALGLPYPVSRHGDFFAWGWGNLGEGTTIVVGGERNGLDAIFDEVDEAMVVHNPWGVDEEQEVPIWVCRRPRADLRTLVEREGVIWG